jgi:hypothetical protein
MRYTAVVCRTQKAETEYTSDITVEVPEDATAEENGEAIERVFSEAEIDLDIDWEEIGDSVDEEYRVFPEDIVVATEIDGGPYLEFGRDAAGELAEGREVNHD